ncbi:MAG: RhuM family protein [Bacilli bacterium]|nr:RhuM family protein [Bacilli bacterium]
MREELEQESVTVKFVTTAKDGKTYKVEHYKFEMINSVGFQVNSKRGIMFRKWTNRVLMAIK